MKNIYKRFSPVLIIVILCLSYSFSQEDTGENLSDESKTEAVDNDKSKKTEETVKETKSDSENQMIENDDEEAEDGEAEVEPVKEKKVVKKVIQKQQPAKNKSGTAPYLEIDKGLLKISPGKTLFERIPEIKLVNKKKSLDVEEIVRIPETLGETQESSKNASGVKGFFGFTEDTTEIIAKGSIILLILMVFVLYKARSSGSSRRT